MELNNYSKRITQDDSQPAAKAMLHAIGLKKKILTNLLWALPAQAMKVILAICI